MTAVVETHDLPAFFRAVGERPGPRALASTPPERPEPDVPAELIDDDNSKVDAVPLPVAAFVDGIQASIIVTYRAHRPVYLMYVAAGAVTRSTGGPLPLGLRQRMAVICSTLDREWVDSLNPTMPVEELPVETPIDIERTAGPLVNHTRDLLERRLVEDLVEQGVHPLALDGSLMGRPYQPELVGIVKSMGRKYLADESFLFRLPMGWRSPRFKIPAGSAGSPLDRYSCYVRLHDARNKAWNFALIRLESFDPNLLDPLAARCMQERQNSASGDARWDRHMASVRCTEEFLRARRPAVFSL